MGIRRRIGICRRSRRRRRSRACGRRGCGGRFGFMIARKMMRGFAWRIFCMRRRSGGGICFQGRRDGRIMFVLPWHDCSLVGTTDTDYRGAAEDVRAERGDVEYLLAEVKGLFPEMSIGERDVITTTAGLRPLLKPMARGGEGAPSGRSREHQIAWQG